MHHSGGVSLDKDLAKDFQPMKLVEVVGLLMQTMEVFQPTGLSFRLLKETLVFKPIKKAPITLGVMVSMMT